MWVVFAAFLVECVAVALLEECFLCVDEDELPCDQPDADNAPAKTKIATLFLPEKT
ncbi:MAG TPA: hypothetical protein VHB45_09310 [Alloacidobacterium sp.]|nr:hypothetical protein [Alloacidobacterium sp.]